MKLITFIPKIFLQFNHTSVKNHRIELAILYHFPDVKFFAVFYTSKCELFIKLDTLNSGFIVPDDGESGEEEERKKGELLGGGENS